MHRSMFRMGYLYSTGVWCTADVFFRSLVEHIYICCFRCQRCYIVRL